MFYLSEWTEHSNTMQSSTCFGRLFQPSSGRIKTTYMELHFWMAEKCCSIWMHSVSSVVFVLIIKKGIDFNIRLQKKWPEILYVQATVHRDNLRINNQQGASSIQNFILSRNSTYFGHLLCPSSGVISCTRGNWYVSCRLCGRCLGSGHITCMKHTSCQVYSW